VTTAEAIRTHLVDGLERQSYEVEGATQLRETIPEVQLAIQNWKPPRMSQNVAFRDYDVSDNDFADLQRLKENKACRPYTPKKRSASTQSPST
jgi:hypothetical protein